MRSLLCAAGLVAVLVSCAGSRPLLRTEFDPTADFSAYSTYGFADQLGTDRAGYATFVTSHFKRAVGREMELLGYRLADDDPDLIVNFFADVRHETDIVGTSDPTWDYYGYRRGLYTGWPLYEVTTVHYQVGTANIDVVDARRKQLVWEGVAEGRLTEESIANPERAISDVVDDLFERFPARAGAPAGARPDDLRRAGS